MKDIDPTQPGTAMIEDVPAAEEAIRVLLLTRPGEKASEPDYGFPILEMADGRSRSRAGFDRSEVTEATRDAILRHVPGITVQDIEPEMTTANQVQALDIGFEIIRSGKTGRVRVELPI